jgi:hypothetical protein
MEREWSVESDSELPVAPAPLSVHFGDSAPRYFASTGSLGAFGVRIFPASHASFSASNR